MSSTSEVPLNLVQVIYDDDIVSIINSLSKEIKDYYINTKKHVQYINSLNSSIENRTLLIKTSINDIIVNNNNTNDKNSSLLVPIQNNVDKVLEIQKTQQESILNMNNELNAHIESMKEYFLKIKQARRNKVEDLVIKNNDFQNNKTPLSQKENNQKELLTPRQHFKRKCNNTNNKDIKDIKGNSFFSNSHDHSDKDKKSSNNKIQKQAQCSLAKNILQFIIDISPLINKQTHPQLESSKHDLQSQANKLLIKDYSSSFNTDNYHYTALLSCQSELQLKSSLLDTANSQIQSLQSQLTAINQENTDIKSLLSQLSSINTSSLQQNNLISSLQQEISSLKSELSSTQQQLKDQASLLQTRNPNNDLQDEITKLTSLYNEKVSKVNKLQNEIASLTKHLKASNDKVHLLESEIESNEVNVSKYQKQIKQLQNQRSKDANKYINKDNILHDKMKLIESLSTENSNSKRVIQALNNDIVKMEEVVKLQMMQINQQKLELETMKQVYGGSNGGGNETQVLKMKIKELENKMKEDKQNLIDNYTNQINVLEQQKQFIEDTIKSKQEKYDNRVDVGGYEKFDIVGHYIYKKGKDELMWYLLQKKKSEIVYENMVWMDQCSIKETLPMYNEYTVKRDRTVEELKEMVEQKEDEIKEIKLKFNKVITNMHKQNKKEEINE